MEKIKKFFWKLNNKRKRALTNFAAWLISRDSKAFMKKMGFKNVRHTLGKHNGLWVIVYACTDYPFNRGNLKVTCDNVIGLNGRNNPCDEKTEDLDKCRDPYSDKVQNIPIR